MAHLEDRWHTKGRNGQVAKTRRHPDNGGNPAAKRWRVRYMDADLRERSLGFQRKADAERFIEHLISRGCLVPRCHDAAVTEEPVLLCKDHLDLVLLEAGRRRANVHDPIVYFARNGSRIKIGWTTNLKSRISKLSLPMSAVALTVDGGPEREAQLHRHFASCRIRGTEWFEATDALEEFIANALAAAA